MKICYVLCSILRAFQFCAAHRLASTRLHALLKKVHVCTCSLGENAHELACSFFVPSLSLPPFALSSFCQQLSPRCPLCPSPARLSPSAIPFSSHIHTSVLRTSYLLSTRIHRIQIPHPSMAIQKSILLIKARARAAQPKRNTRRTCVNNLSAEQRSAIALKSAETRRRVDADVVSEHRRQLDAADRISAAYNIPRAKVLRRIKHISKVFKPHRTNKYNAFQFAKSLDVNAGECIWSF